MLNIPESIKTLFKTDGVFKNFRVHFPNGEHADLTNSDIVSESVKFTESICSKEVFQFGLSERSQIEFECVNVPNIYGATIECGIEIDTSSLSASEIADIQSGTYDGTLVLEADSDIGFGYFHIPYGVFVVQSCPRSHGAMYRRRVTAYSSEAGSIYTEYNSLLNGTFPFKYIDVDSSAVQYLIGSATADTRTITPISATGANPGGGYGYALFYNSSGTETEIRFKSETPYQRADIGETESLYGDFLYIESSIDYEKYEQNGMAIVKAIDDAGLDLRYDAKKNRVFATNEDAIRAKAPWLFSPVVIYGYADVYAISDDARGRLDDAIKLHDGLNALVVTEFWENHAFVGKDTSPKSLLDAGFGITPHYFLTQGTYDNTLYVFGQTLTYQRIEYEYTVTKIESRKIPSAQQTGIKLRLNSVLVNDGHLFNIFNLSTGTTYADRKYKKYTFQNSISFSELIAGFLEINANFGKIGREGIDTEMALSKTNPVYITPSEIDELWWDEYDVEEIGLVRYKIADTDSTVDYKIGNGGSIYEFGDNYFIKRIFMSYTEETYSDAIALINSVIDRYFAPNVVDVPFVPVDMQMIGLPFVESGDYVIYEDGTNQIGTYVLNHVITGIQTLFDSTESKGGEVMGDGN